jgi:hypothetical protein
LTSACRDTPKREDTHLIRRLSWVAFFLEVGLLLVVLPWSEFWEHNYFAATLPAVGSIVTNNFVRGGVTGLGVVNLVVGFAELGLIMATRERTRRGAADDVERRSAALGDSTEHPL